MAAAWAAAAAAVASEEVARGELARAAAEVEASAVESASAAAAGWVVAEVEAVGAMVVPTGCQARASCWRRRTHRGRRTQRRRL